MLSTLKQSLISYLIGKDKVVIEASEYLKLSMKKEQPMATPLTPAQLTQKQLGSYLPNFEHLSLKGDQFKYDLGALCKTLITSEHWNYLVTHLKQDQVNMQLFSDTKDEMFVRGSINGIYVVADMVSNLGTSHVENKPLKKKDSLNP